MHDAASQSTVAPDLLRKAERIAAYSFRLYQQVNVPENSLAGREMFLGMFDQSCTFLKTLWPEKYPDGMTMDAAWCASIEQDSAEGKTDAQ